MQNIFSKIDKKILLIMLVIIAVILVAAFFIYNYSKDVKKEMESTENEIMFNEEELSPEQGEQPQVEIEDVQIETQSDSGLTICVDQCGDNICQPAGTICSDNLNCICAETKTDCPSDCK